MAGLMIRDSALREYADLLERNGFTIYESKSPTAEHFTYSRVVKGQECFGNVQRNYAMGTAYSHHMPIKPTARNGSSMWVQNVPDELTVLAAKTIARPNNFNPLVGFQKNYRDDYWIERLYIKREGK